MSESDLRGLEGGGRAAAARDLRYFEAFYPDIEPVTYVWYQFRFTMMAKGLVDAGGPNMLRRLWDAFALPDGQLADVLAGRVHPAAGQWLASWSELQADASVIISPAQRTSSPLTDADPPV